MRLFFSVERAHTMDAPINGYCVFTRPSADDKETKQRRDALTALGLVDLKSTRAFNMATARGFTSAIDEVNGRVRSRTERRRNSRLEYHAREDVKAKKAAYAQDPAVKARKAARARAKYMALKKVREANSGEYYKALEESSKDVEIQVAKTLTPPPAVKVTKSVK